MHVWKLGEAETVKGNCCRVKLRQVESFRSMACVSTHRQTKRYHWVRMVQALSQSTFNPTRFEAPRICFNLIVLPVVGAIHRWWSDSFDMILAMWRAQLFPWHCCVQPDEVDQQNNWNYYIIFHNNKTWITLHIFCRQPITLHIFASK